MPKGTSISIYARFSVNFCVYGFQRSVDTMSLGRVKECKSVNATGIPNAIRSKADANPADRDLSDFISGSRGMIINRSVTVVQETDYEVLTRWFDDTSAATCAARRYIDCDVNPTSVPCAF